MQCCLGGLNSEISDDVDYSIVNDGAPRNGVPVGSAANRMKCRTDAAKSARSIHKVGSQYT